MTIQVIFNFSAAAEAADALALLAGAGYVSPKVGGVGAADAVHLLAGGAAQATSPTPKPAETAAPAATTPPATQEAKTQVPAAPATKATAGKAAKTPAPAPAAAPAEQPTPAASTSLAGKSYPETGIKELINGYLNKDAVKNRPVLVSLLAALGGAKSGPEIKPEYYDAAHAALTLLMGGADPAEVLKGVTPEESMG